MQNEKNLKGKDGANYTRIQKGHSLILAIALGWLTLYIVPIYWAISKDHYYHM